MKVTWKLIRTLINSKKTNSLKTTKRLFSNNAFYTDKARIYEQLNDYFINIGNKLADHLPPNNTNPTSHIKQSFLNSFMSRCIHSQEVYDKLSLGQTLYFTRTESNAIEKNPLLSLIFIVNDFANLPGKGKHGSMKETMAPFHPCTISGDGNVSQVIISTIVYLPYFLDSCTHALLSFQSCRILDVILMFLVTSFGHGPRDIQSTAYLCQCYIASSNQLGGKNSTPIYWENCPVLQSVLKEVSSPHSSHLKVREPSLQFLQTAACSIPEARLSTSKTRLPEQSSLRS